MKVRTKFMVTKISEAQSGFEISLNPVTAGSKENEQFFKYTPYGSITFGTINAEAARQFEVGKSYYVDFSEV